jgi:hypothetical protein
VCQTENVGGVEVLKGGDATICCIENETCDKAFEKRQTCNSDYVQISTAGVRCSGEDCKITSAGSDHNTCCILRENCSERNCPTNFSKRTATGGALLCVREMCQTETVDGVEVLNGADATTCWGDQIRGNNSSSTGNK